MKNKMTIIDTVSNITDFGLEGHHTVAYNGEYHKVNFEQSKESKLYGSLQWGSTKEIMKFCENKTDEIVGNYLKVKNEMKNEIDILRKYVDEENWEIVTLEECISKTEGNGYWKKDTVEEMLKQGVVVFTPFAEYKKEELK